MLELNLFMESEHLKYWIAFNRVPGIGRARFKLLESYFGTLDNAWQASSSDFQAAGLDKTVPLYTVFTVET